MSFWYQNEVDNWVFDLGGDDRAMILPRADQPGFRLIWYRQSEVDGQWFQAISDEKVATWGYFDTIDEAKEFVATVKPVLEATVKNDERDGIPARLTSEQARQVLDQMRESDNAKFRDIAVIATWLLEQPWTFCDGDGIEEFDAIEAVKSLIQAQTDAGLGTFVLDGLKAYIESMQQVKSMPTLAPKLGRVWKYGSGPWAAS